MNTEIICALIAGIATVVAALAELAQLVLLLQSTLEQLQLVNPVRRLLSPILEMLQTPCLTSPFPKVKKATRATRVTLAMLVLLLSINRRFLRRRQFQF